MQIKDLYINTSSTYWDIFNQLLIIAGVITGLIYFFFSTEHKGIIGKASRVGIFYLMIKFGASFGFAVMGRISLLIGRFEELIEYSNPQYSYATYWLIVATVASLVVWFMMENKSQSNKDDGPAKMEVK